MASGGAGETATGNLRHARLSDVCTWVKRSWDEISDEIIFESFKTCGISTDLNESDSDLEITDKESDDDNISGDDGNDDIIGGGNDSN